jgi:hypothetical protein
MAKVTGPLMSMEASGTFGKTLTFGNRLGSNVVRKRVVPSNPRNAGQTAARNMQRVAAAIQANVNMETYKGAGRLVTDKAAIAAITPSGMRWNSYLVKAIIGTGQVNYDAATAAWGVISGSHAAWENAGSTTKHQAFVSVAQKVAVTNADDTAITPGELFFRLVYALYTLGIGAAPTGTPPNYSA